MTRYRVLPALLLALLFSVPVVSYGESASPGGPAKKTFIKVTGEILDMGCFTSHGLRGSTHRECARQCLSVGVPVGLVTADGVVYVLTQNHDRAMAPSNFPPPDPYALCRTWPSLQVDVTGFVWERNGSKFLEVLSAKIAPPIEPAG